MELHAVFRACRSLSKSYRRSKSKWAAGIDQEVSGWDSWLKGEGMAWADSRADYQRRLDPNAGLGDWLNALMDHLSDNPLKILDLGSGPLTSLGKTHPTKRLEIIATDPLAPHYDRLLEKYKLTPPVRTIAVAAESLTSKFATNTFHLATAFNCLDHAIDPVEAIRQTVSVVKPSCRLLMVHYENEGQNENYTGLHQWNFTIQGGDFIISNGHSSTNVTRVLGSSASVRAFRDNGSFWGDPSQNKFIIVIIRKHTAAA
ncbi:MAG: class I SAM-dependent methyltransferase [Isosphaerales bacterium]